MARSYDGAGNTSAREQVEHGKQLEKARNQKIEVGVIIGATVIAGLSILINTGKCISAASATKDYNAQRVEAEATLEELNAKLQDPTAQNYVYKDPTVGNMTDTGQAIAMLQNQIIAANQSHNGLTYNGSTNSGDHAASTSQTGGAVLQISRRIISHSRLRMWIMYRILKIQRGHGMVIGNFQEHMIIP